MARRKNIQKDLDSILSMLKLMDKMVAAREMGARFDERPAPPLYNSQNEPTRIKRVPRRKQRVLAPKRFGFSAKVLIHKNNRYVKGMALNVSKSGLFVVAGRSVFKPNEMVRVYIRPTGMSRSYQVIATIARFGRGPSQSQGYGLQFCKPML